MKENFQGTFMVLNLPQWKLVLHRYQCNLFRFSLLSTFFIKHFDPLLNLRWIAHSITRLLCENQFDPLSKWSTRPLWSTLEMAKITLIQFRIIVFELTKIFFLKLRILPILKRVKLRCLKILNVDQTKNRYKVVECKVYIDTPR